jgi:hypothetical protein
MAKKEWTDAERWEIVKESMDHSRYYESIGDRKNRDLYSESANRVLDSMEKGRGSK